MTPGQNEAFSRILIDKALEASGWNLFDPQQVKFEHNTVNGRADYQEDALERAGAGGHGGVAAGVGERRQGARRVR